MIQNPAPRQTTHPAWDSINGEFHLRSTGYDGTCHPAKQILQELYRLKCGGNENISERLEQKWSKCIREQIIRLENALNLTVLDTQSQFHIFSDASESGLRWIDR